MTARQSLETPTDLLALAEEAVAAARRAGADEAEVCVTRLRGSSVSLQKDDIHSAATEDETTCGVRVLIGGSLGFASTNDPETLTATAAEAVALARTTPPDPRNGFADAASSEPLQGLVDPELIRVDVGALTEAADELLARIREADPRVRIDSGGVSTERLSRAIANSRGVLAADERATAGGSVFGMAIDGADVGSFDAEGDVVRRAADLRTALRAAADRFVLKTTGALGARKAESFRGPVIFSPEAVLEFVLGNLAATLSGKAVRTKKSPFAGKLGEAIADLRFTLRDQPRLTERASAASFDREGTPTADRVLIENGVLRSFLYDSFEGRAAGTRSTGNARGGASAAPAVAPWSLSLQPGTTPLAQLCSEPERAIFVSRFSGSANPTTGEFSGVVKGGFLLRRESRTPIKEVQLSGNIYELIRRATASIETRVIEGGASAPALRFEDVSVTAG